MAKKKRKINKKPHVKRDAFLAAFAECGTIGGAAKAANIDRGTHYLWLEDEKYAKDFEVAAQAAADKLEDEARRRAHDGVMRLKFHQGAVIMDPLSPKDADGNPTLPYIEHEYSDTLLIFLLKGAKPDKYRENVDLTSKGKALTFHPITLDGDKQANG